MYELYRSGERLSASDIEMRYGISRSTAYNRLNRLFGFSFLLRVEDYRCASRRVPWIYFVTDSVKYAFQLWESEGKEIYISPKHVMEAIHDSVDATIESWFH